MASMLDFSGKQVLVTGAGRGIGRAVVKALVAAGGDVYGLDVIKENLDSLVKEFPTVHPIHVDLADWEATRREVDKLGPLDGLVNGGGVLGATGFCLDIGKEEIHNVFNVNLFGAINVSQSVAKKMVDAKKGGSIVNISSIAATRAGPGIMPYSASKAALDMVTKQFAAEIGPHSIRVNSVMLTYVKTDMTAHFPEIPGLLSSMKERTPLPRFPEMQEIVEPILYLLSSHSSAVTGTLHRVDGGILCC